jgi:hypothetical protein
MRNTQNDLLFRGRAKQVGTFTTAKELLQQVGLDWKVCEMPVLVQGKTQNRVFPGRKALVRCDNGHMIDITSDKFVVHQNEQLVNGMVEAAHAANIKLTAGGCINGGSQVFLHGTADKTFDAKTVMQIRDETNGTYDQKNAAVSKAGAKIGDIVRLDFTMRGGHTPGSPSTVTAQAMRLVCLNAASVMDSQFSYRCTHRNALDKASAQRMIAFMAQAARAFETYEEKAKRLTGTAFTRDMTRAYVLDLIAPQLLVQAMTNYRGTPSHAQLLDSIVDGNSTVDAVEWLLSGDAAKVNEAYKVPRTVNQVLEAVTTQPGYELSRGTAWNAYNGVTYYVDHVRGRDEGDAAIESALSGAGEKLKGRALDLAVAYAERMGA